MELADQWVDRLMDGRMTRWRGGHMDRGTDRRVNKWQIDGSLWPACGCLFGRWEGRDAWFQGNKEMLTLKAAIHPILRHTYQDPFSPLLRPPRLKDWLY